MVTIGLMDYGCFHLLARLLVETSIERFSKVSVNVFRTNLAIFWSSSHTFWPWLTDMIACLPFILPALGDPSPGEQSATLPRRVVILDPGTTISDSRDQKSSPSHESWRTVLGNNKLYIFLPFNSTWKYMNLSHSISMNFNLANFIWC